jgi:hypothetical protein
VARSPRNLPIPRDILVELPWRELLERMTAMAATRLARRPPDDARQLAIEAVRVFLDPASSVVWDYDTEPDPSRCLGSILNGLFRNYFRTRRTTSEVATDQHTLERVAGSDADATPEQQVIDHDLAEAALRRVALDSATDPLVCQLVELASSGVIEIDDQLTALSVSKPLLYEARRRFRERLENALRELEYDNAE